jgi:6-phosphofructokinase 1
MFAMGTIKGNAIVGQSGGPTAAINATLCGVIRGMLNYAPQCRLFGMRNGIEGCLQERMVDLTDLFTLEDGKTPDEAALKLLTHTPAAALGSCRRKLPDPSLAENEAFYEKLLDIFKKNNIDTFFYIGGNDSMDTVAKLSAYTRRVGYPLTVIGVPKTIDNDLEGTDHTPGFGSAAKFVATTMQEILQDCAVYTIPAVTIVEIMGRDAGWLTASSAIGRVVNGLAPDYVYLPERAFSMDAFMEDVRAALKRHPNVVIAVSEGIRFADGTPVGASVQSGGQATDVFGHSALAGAGKALEFAVKAEIGCKVRSVELNLPQRCAGHLLSATDIEESLRVGQGAVKAASEGVSGVMMTIQRSSTAPYVSEISHSPVAAIANMVRRVPYEFINTENNHVTDACCAYLAPLITGETSPAYRGGLPVFFTFD